ncbi:hypothetical protein Cenrod_2552 [Candidatus Symbiobacter mobilis CR]|uniref:Uncharacterized protein n=1 Tax=Candidatus Symbiobacter mobilis CR TaxID=946483 RepID=U5NAL5_9BURK|nr:hypothetical protein Cenrod_2552 [Candidatus Symbiobacter mobilis CR]
MRPVVHHERGGGGGGFVRRHGSFSWSMNPGTAGDRAQGILPKGCSGPHSTHTFEPKYGMARTEGKTCCT